MKSIAVYCGSADNVNADYISAARGLGILLAERDIRLVYGGGKTGLMGAIADGAIEAGGEVVGVITRAMNTDALAHGGLTALEVTESIHERKARMVALSDGFIAMPGGYGTFDELFETVTWAQIGIHEKPVGLLNVRQYFAHLLQALDFATSEGFIYPDHRQMLYCSSSPVDLLEMMSAHEHPVEAVKRWMREG